MLVGGYLYAENKAEGKLESSFFYLRQGSLRWKKASNADSDQGSIHLLQCADEDAVLVGEVTPRRREGKQLHRFEVETKGSSLKLFARSDEERQAWVNSIKMGVIANKLQSEEAKDMGDKLWSKGGDAIFELQDAILQMQLGDDYSDAPSLDDQAEVGPLVKEKLTEAMMKARMETSDAEWQDRLSRQAEEHEAELAAVRMSAGDLRRKVETLEKQIEDSPMTTPASSARLPTQEAFEELTRRAEWLEKRLKEAEDREDELLEQKEVADRAQQVLESQMATLSGQFQHASGPVRWDKQVERLQEELKDRDEELHRVKKQLKIERAEAESGFRQRRLSREHREEELQALREAARSHEVTVLDKTEQIAGLHEELMNLKKHMRGREETERVAETSAAKEVAVAVGDIKAKHQEEVADKEGQIERLRDLLKKSEHERKTLSERVTELVRGREEIEKAHYRALAAVEEEQKVQEDISKLRYEERISDMEKLVALARAEESTQLRDARDELAVATERLREATNGLREAESRSSELLAAKSKLELDFDRVSEENLEAAAVIRRLEHVIQTSREEQDSRGKDMVESMRDVQRKTQEETGQRLQQVHILRATTEQLVADRNAVADQLDNVKFVLDAVASALHCPNDASLPRRAAEMWETNRELKEAADESRRLLEVERLRMDRELRTTLETMGKEAEDARRSWKEADAGLASLTNLLERTEGERDAARQELAALRNELVTESTALASYKDKSSKLLKQVTGEAERMNQLETEHSELLTKLAQADLRARQGEKDVANLVEQHKGFEMQIAQLHNESRDQELRAEEASQLSKKLRRALDEQAMLLQTREKEVAGELAAQAAQHEQEWKKAQSELRATMAERDKALEQVAELQEQHKRLASSMEDVDLKNKVLDHECTTMKWKHENAEASAQRARMEAEKLRGILHSQAQQVAHLDSAVQLERLHSTKEETLKMAMEVKAEAARTEAAAAIERERRRTKELMSVVSTVWDYRGKEARDSARLPSSSVQSHLAKDRPSTARLWTKKDSTSDAPFELERYLRPDLVPKAVSGASERPRSNFGSQLGGHSPALLGVIGQ